MTTNAAIEFDQNAPTEATLDNGIFRIVMRRPENMNALSLDMMAALHESLDFAQGDPDTRLVMIYGSGKAFCAGHDLKELTGHRADADGGKEFYAQTMNRCSELMQKIVNLPKPVIAVVNGVATAAGCQLVASCDLALANARATFCTPGVNIGLFCSTPMVALSRNVSRKQAMEMLLTGESIDAETALDIGLVNRIVPDRDPESFIAEYGARIAAKSASTLKIGKEAFYRQLEMPLAKAYDFCADVMVQNMMNADAKEGINAFLQKREPKWHGR